MRIYADVNRLDETAPEPASIIIQAGADPEIGATTVINGQFVVPVPPGVTLPPLDPTTRLTGVATVLDAVYGRLLAAYPQYAYIRYNALLQGSGQALLDPAATVTVPGPSTYITRAQMGRSTGGTVDGLAPLGVALLPPNATNLVLRPGMVSTRTINIIADRPLGTDQYCVYWQLYVLNATHDVADYAVGGPNVPATKVLTEIDQEPAGLEVYLSDDAGATYAQVRRLQPFAAAAAGTDVRLAFVNKAAEKLYLAAYAVMY